MTYTTKLMFDIDGVLADFCHGYFRVASGLFPEKASLMTHLNTLNRAKWDDYGPLTKEEVGEVYRIIDKAPCFWSNLPTLLTMDESITLAALSRDANYELYFVTHRHGVAPRIQTIEWLRGVVGIANPTVLVTHRKGETARALGVKAMIDDKAGNALHGYYHTEGKTQVYLIDRPYNRMDHDVAGKGIIRVPSVAEFLERTT